MVPILLEEEEEIVREIKERAADLFKRMEMKRSGNDKSTEGKDVYDEVKNKEKWGSLEVH